MTLLSFSLSRPTAMANLCCLILILTASVWAAHAVPEIDPNEWWGPQDSTLDASHVERRRSIRPFKIHFKQEMIVDLRKRLLNNRAYTPPLEDAAFNYGFNPDQIDFWVNYWAKKYNFTERESFLNKFPQYITNIQGLDMHFVHVIPEVPEGMTSVPLLLLHGFPGSVREFYEAIPILTSPANGFNFVFEVFAPSLPGYGFSSGADRPGLGPVQMAAVLKNLMKKLGHSQFYLAGGDWGANVGRAMTTMYQDDILGFHTLTLSVLNSCAELKNAVGGYIADIQVDLQQYNRTPLTDLFEETGYMHLQATKCDSVGIALSDSPVALFAWTLEKFSSWTDKNNRLLADGGLLNAFSPEALFDNVMIYWVSNCITTSMRLYAEYFSNAQRTIAIDDYPVYTPVWGCSPPNDMFPSSWNRMKYLNIIGTTTLEKGGHYLAFELPDVYCADVFKAVRAFREL